MDSSNLITIFTPCYNRAHLLPQLYQSLLKQGSTNFEWLIVDDGSTDNTLQIVENFKLENKIPISYLYKPNGGKHTAINFGVQKAKGKLFFIVDSDDFLANEAVDLTNKAWNTIRDNESICGIIGISKYTNGQLVGDAFKEDNWVIPFSDYYLKYKLRGDKSVAFKTSVMKEFPFPEKEGIRYVFEDVIWSEISKKYNVICLNKVIQFKEYLVAGISDSSYKKWYVKSMAFSYFQLVLNNTHPIDKYTKKHFDNYVHLIINSLLSKTSYFDQLPTIKNKLIYLILFPRAYYSYLNLKNKIIE